MAPDNQYLEEIRRIAAVHYRHLGDPELAMSAMSPDVIYHGRPSAPKTLEEWKRRESRFQIAMSNIKTTISRQVAEGDMVATQWQLSAVHTGPLMGHAPTNKEIFMKSMCFDRVVDGLVVEHWGVRDLLSVLRQIDAVPTFDPNQ